MTVRADRFSTDLGHARPCLGTALNQIEERRRRVGPNARRRGSEIDDGIAAKQTKAWRRVESQRKHGVFHRVGSGMWNVSLLNKRVLGSILRATSRAVPYGKAASCGPRIS